LKQISQITADCLNNANIISPFIGGIDLQKYNPRLFAYGDGITKLELWPFTYPLIGRWLDRLRPVNFASKILCHGIKTILSLPDDCMIPLLGNGKEDMAIIRIPMSLFNDEDCVEQLTRFIVPCDETTYRIQFDQRRGEFMMESGEPIYTLRRYRQKFKDLHVIQDHYALFSILPKKYCELLEINLVLHFA
jgi:hypothetical protein